MPYKTFFNWAFSGNIKDPIPVGEGVPDILKYNSPIHATFLLKSFFSEGIQTDNGEEVSNREVKSILANCIAAEDKKNPLPDEKLAEIIQEKGYNIARRTIAKYREQLNLPVARLRREM